MRSNRVRGSSAMYAKLHYPDMDGLSRRPLTAGQFAAAFFERVLQPEH